MISKDLLFTLTESAVPCESSREHVRWGKAAGLSSSVKESKTPAQLSVIPDTCQLAIPPLHMVNLGS